MLRVKIFHLFPTVWEKFWQTFQGKGKRILGAWEARRAREEGGSTRSSPPFTLARGLAPKFPSRLFRTLASQARDNQVILWSYSTKKSIANQTISIKAIFVTQQKRALRDKTKPLHGGTNSLRAQPIIVSSRKVPPHKGARGALRDKNKELLHKSAWIRLACRHNNTNVDTVFRVYYWQSKYDERSHKSLKRK